MTNNYSQLKANERTWIRNFLKTHAHWAYATICSPDEPGTKINIKGKLTDEKGVPIGNADLFVFQTDSHGYYTPEDSITKSMGESDPRIFGFIRTDNEGAYDLRTIRPASYPIKFQGSYVPQHIHFNINAAGFKKRNIQMVFEDDPAMTSKWMEWAKNLNFPVIKIIYSEKQPFGIKNIVMVK